MVQSYFIDACCCTEHWFRTGESDNPLSPPRIRILKRADDTLELFLRAGIMERGDIMTAKRYDTARGEAARFPDSFWALWDRTGDTQVFHGRI